MSEELEDENLERDEELESTEGGQLENVIQVSGMYNEWFLDYASYVILERAVPHLHDGLKPVQRRILHSLREMDDGRFHKVANAIGNTMKFHPHGDASIGDAMVQIGQKEILLDTQGNWGNIYTGDRAAAPRYIEVKLSKFALDVVFNYKTTNWLASYDGRNKEPETLPVKFPLLLAQGVEGIAVGLACKILPHNFNELIDGSIDVLKGRKTDILPDFQTGGMADFSNYNDGLRGGKIKVRARIRKEDERTLIIHEIPFSTTTSSLIDSILKANDSGKIKIKKIEDNTAEFVEIAIHLPKGVSPDKTIDALYAFTDCESSISPNAGVIEDDKPKFLGVNDMLQASTVRTKDLLGQELEIKLGELQESWHFASLEKIFIEKRVYRDIEECETWEEILAAIHAGLKPHIKHLLREVTDEDVTRLTEIRIKRISKFDSFKADEKIAGLEGEIEGVKHNLDNLNDFAINYFKELKKKYGEGRERKTEITQFDNIDGAKVAISNAKLYANMEEGFVGTGMKRGEGDFVCDCSDIDDIIIFREDGKMLVTRVSTKAFVGKGIIHIRVWKKGDKRTTYNMIYRDGKNGKTMMKRFQVTSITRDKEYDLGKGNPNSQVLYFSANPNGEAEVVTVMLRQLERLKKLKIDIDFSELAIKGRGAGGNTITKYPVKRVELKEKGVSTLGARKIWYDPTVRRLNAEERGQFLGKFQPSDKILVLLDSGEYKFTGFDISTHFDDNMMHLEKWMPNRPVSAVYYDPEKDQWFVKRFLAEYSTKAVKFISDHEDSKLGLATTLNYPVCSIKFNKKFKHTRDKDDQDVNLWEFIGVKGYKAIGNKLTALPVTEVYLKEADEEKEAEANAALEAEIQPTQENSEPESASNNDSEDSADESATPISANESVDEPSSSEKSPPATVSGPETKKPAAQKPMEVVPDDVSPTIELSVDGTSDDSKKDEGQISMF
jgi:topoisomerase IV subunit A